MSVTPVGVPWWKSEAWGMEENQLRGPNVNHVDRLLGDLLTSMGGSRFGKAVLR